MSKLYSFKRICALAAAFVMTAGAAGSGTLKSTPAVAESEAEYYDDAYSQQDDSYESDSYIEDSEISESGVSDSSADATESEYFYEGSENSVPTDESSEEETNTGFDITVYAERLREISEEQSKLDAEISQAQSDIEDQEKTQETILKKIDSINEEIDVLNSYMTALEIEISTNKRELAGTKEEIDDGIEAFKKRLRAMYIAGTDSYTSVLLESESFYDVLMRMELIKRVANHDNTMIENLYSLQDKYEAKQAELDAKQAEYDKQYETYIKEKSALDSLYEYSEETKKQLEEKQAELEAQNEAYEQEKSQFEQDLSGILKSSTGTSSRDEAVAATMVLADKKLEELHAAIKERLDNGEELGEYEAQYEFAWPVPGCYSVSSGVGARWGSYHSGIDIPGAHGTSIHASESGTVLRINTTCTHDYGKTESCGCGGGYGNYVIIDHGNGFITLYGHLTEVDVLPGDQVKQGDVIGKMGSTGFSTGDHLHFEIRYDGYIVNPAYYVNVN